MNIILRIIRSSAVCALTFFCCMLSGHGEQPPKSVAVVFSGSNNIYGEAWREANTVLQKHPLSPVVMEYNLQNQTAQNISQEIGKTKPDTILVFGTKAAQFVHEHFSILPVVFAIVLDPSPILGTKVTGVLMDVPIDEQLNMMQRIMPGLKRIGVFYSPATKNAYNEINDACQKRGLILKGWQIRDKQEIPFAINDIDGKIDCFLMIPDVSIFFLQSIRDLLTEGLTKRFPIVGLSSHFTEAGALFSLESDYVSLGKQAAGILLQVLNGRDTSEIPPEKPRKLKLSVNLAVAERLKISIPKSVLNQASEVFGR